MRFTKELQQSSSQVLSQHKQLKSKCQNIFLPQSYCVCGLLPSSGDFGSRNKTFRKLDLFPYSGERGGVQCLRLARSKGTNWVGVFSLPSPEDGNRSSFGNVVFLLTKTAEIINRKFVCYTLLSEPFKIYSFSRSVLHFPFNLSCHHSFFLGIFPLFSSSLLIPLFHSFILSLFLIVHTNLPLVSLPTLMKTQLNSVALFRKRTTPTERPPLVGELSSNFCRFRVTRGHRNGFPRPLLSCF
jgi:hypothetical protein